MKCFFFFFSLRIERTGKWINMTNDWINLPNECMNNAFFFFTARRKTRKIRFVEQFEFGTKKKRSQFAPFFVYVIRSILYPHWTIYPFDFTEIDLIESKYKLIWPQGLLINWYHLNWFFSISIFVEQLNVLEPNLLRVFWKCVLNIFALPS